jgi:hypothetical protein
MNHERESKSVVGHRDYLFSNWNFRKIRPQASAASLGPVSMRLDGGGRTASEVKPRSGGRFLAVPSSSGSRLIATQSADHISRSCDEDHASSRQCGPPTGFRYRAGRFRTGQFILQFAPLYPQVFDVGRGHWPLHALLASVVLSVLALIGGLHLRDRTSEAQSTITGSGVTSPAVGPVTNEGGAGLRSAPPQLCSATLVGRLWSGRLGALSLLCGCGLALLLPLSILR